VSRYYAQPKRARAGPFPAAGDDDHADPLFGDSDGDDAWAERLWADMQAHKRQQRSQVRRAGLDGAGNGAVVRGLRGRTHHPHGDEMMLTKGS
jgi:hypothetical protein